MGFPTARTSSGRGRQSWVGTSVPRLTDGPASYNRNLQAPSQAYRKFSGVCSCRAGLRVSEVARLKLEQIDWEQQALHIVQGKGRKDRRVYMSPDAVASVQQCLAQPPRVQAQGYVFWNRKRAQQPLSVKAIQKKMERYAKAAGITAK